MNHKKQLHKIINVLEQLKIHEIRINSIKIPVKSETKKIIKFQSTVKRRMDESIPPAYIQSELCNLLTKQMCNSRCVKYTTETIDWSPEPPYYIEYAEVEVLEQNIYR